MSQNRSAKTAAQISRRLAAASDSWITRKIAKRIKFFKCLPYSHQLNSKRFHVEISEHLSGKIANDVRFNGAGVNFKDAGIANFILIRMFELFVIFFHKVLLQILREKIG